MLTSKGSCGQPIDSTQAISKLNVFLCTAEEVTIHKYVSANKVQGHRASDEDNTYPTGSTVADTEIWASDKQDISSVALMTYPHDLENVGDADTSSDHDRDFFRALPCDSTVLSPPACRLCDEQVTNSQDSRHAHPYLIASVTPDIVTTVAFDFEL